MASRGGKCTNYFCNLEKKQYTEKIIPKLIDENGCEITDQFQILERQKLFYENLYTSSSPVSDQEHENLFFNRDNPFINFLSDDEKGQLEIDLQERECLNVIKKMKNGKSPGIDGYTTEFYKFFWSDLKKYLMKSYNFSFDNGHLSVSQTQGMITCLPKEGKSKFYLKNWRPITLLNVDTKIISAAIANRIKPLLKTLISETQQGFIKGRYIGECTRLVYDLIEKTEEEDIPGLLVLIDFEKAFDTLEWSFMDKALNFYGFGSNICKWVKVLYANAQSCVINNGHCSNFFTIKRGVRQGDPLSPYLFILALELMSAAIKYTPNINGIKIDNSEYLLSQYADDSALFLDDSEESLRNSIYILEKFAECAGLKANFDKTEAIWFGSRVRLKEKLLPDINLNWNWSGKFKLLGIRFDLFAEDKTLHNFTEKIEKIKALLNSWIYRDLTTMGKITVIKSLALPILIQSLTVLPNPSPDIFKDLENIFYSFLWNKKPDKVKRKVIINSYEKGGLKMPHLESFCMSLKMTWINKILDPFNISPWKTLIIDQYKKYGGDKIWMMNSYSLNKIAVFFNSFWKDIIKNWAKLREEPIHNDEKLLSQSIWFNQKLKIDNEIIFYEKWCKEGIFYLNDLLNENNEFYSFQEFVGVYNIDTTFLHFLGILHMIPNSWKEKIIGTQKMQEISCDIFDFVKGNKKSSQYFYKKFIVAFSEEPLKQHEKWKVKLNTDISSEEWECFHSLPFRCSKNNKLINFQYKILLRILNTNSLLYKCNLVETPMCSFCMETQETILHLFWECSFSKNLWFEVRDTLKTTCQFDLPISAEEVILGSTNNDDFTNYIIVLVKYYLYICKLKDSKPSFIDVKKYLQQTYKIEKLSIIYYKSPAIAEKIQRKWDLLKMILQGE